MKIYFSVILKFVVTTLVVNSLTAQAQDVSSAQCLTLMQSSNSIVRDRALHILEKNRAEMVQSLIRILDGKAPLEVRLEAARALGKYRASEAVEVLVKNLGLEQQDHDVGGGLVTDEDYAYLVWPVSTALEKIGQPAFTKVLESMEINDDPKMRTASLKILCRIEGDKDIVLLRLKKVMEVEQDPSKKARLQAAVDSLPEVKL